MDGYLRDRALTIAFIGFPAERSQLLIGALKGAMSRTLSSRIIEGSLDQLDLSDIEDSIIFSYADNSTETDKIFASYKRLRSEKYFWNSIFSFTRTPPQLPNATADWAVYFQRMPPFIKDLVSALSEGMPVSQERRIEIVFSALVDVAEKLNTFISSSESKNVVEPNRLKGSVADVIHQLEASNKNVSYQELYQLLVKIEGEPEAKPEEIEVIIGLLNQAESTEREKEKSSTFLTRVHGLNNVLRLALVERVDASGVLRQALPEIKSLLDRGITELPLRLRSTVSEILEHLREAVEGTLNSDHERVYQQQLGHYLKKLYEVIFSHNEDSDPAATVTRIVIVEDDPDWQRQTAKVIKGMVEAAGIEVETANTLNQAQLLLKDHKPALVLVDLGLPPEDDTDILTDAGLTLVRMFSGADKQGRRFRHRFVITTAAENYPEAVREALSFGIGSRSYIQKHPLTWESDLRAQVRLALQPPALRPPIVEIFKRTGRIARVEGLEIILDYPHWCLLTILAESRRGVWNEPGKLAHILYWNYSLNPESRSAENDDLDPQERLLLQLPHYVSDLRQRLADAYKQSTNQPLPMEIISFEENVGYRLNAQASVLDRVDEHFRQARRPSVLIVEDNTEWGRKIEQELNRRGFETRLARCTEDARKLVEEELPDLISLDLELPSTSEELERGIADADRSVEFVNYLRNSHGQIPVTILTAVPWRDKIMLEMLRRGVRVDDYLSKHSDHPTVRLANSLARLWQETLTRTRILDWDPSAPLHPIFINPEKGILSSVANYPVNPAGQGKTILKALSATPNVFVSRTELIEAVYGTIDDVDKLPEDLEKALNQHIKRLRQTITDATNKTILGDQIVCGDRGIYWLRGLVQ